MELIDREVMRKNAGKLRRNMTKEEKHLWYDFLRKLPGHFRRQYVIGNYIADFYSEAYKLVIELDGSQHDGPEAIEYDRKRTAYLKSRDNRVMRFDNYEINTRFEDICTTILQELGQL